MHRTTVSLESPVERKVRSLAGKRRVSLNQFVNELIKRGLKAFEEQKQEKKEFKWHVSDGQPKPSFDPSDRGTYADIIGRKVRFFK